MSSYQKAAVSTELWRSAGLGHFTAEFSVKCRTGLVGMGCLGRSESSRYQIICMSINSTRAGTVFLS